jgi:FtsP/CotA-like multicopper oxidase with cupredoxin domain
VIQLRPFQDSLPIPDVIKPSPAGHLKMSAKVQNVKLHQDLPETKVWSYTSQDQYFVKLGQGTTYLGPTIEVFRGDRVRVNWENEIPADETLPYEVIKVPSNEKDIVIPQNNPGRLGALSKTEDEIRATLHNFKSALVTHLHGGRTQADSDGWPDNTAVSGQVARYTYGNDQPATMLWYHDHAINATRLNVYAGLAGAWLIRDEAEDALCLPSGDAEIPLIIQDRNLDLDDAAAAFTGALLHKTEVQKIDPVDPNTPGGPAEFFGPYTLVNGKIWPMLAVEPKLYRFRVLNGSNARTYRLVLLDDQGHIQNLVIYQIGSDQGLLEGKVSIPDEGVVLAPAERIDILVDFSDPALQGKSLYLWNTAEAPFGNAAAPSAAQVKTEFDSFNADSLARAGVESERRPFPQIMRFDVGTESISECLHHLPNDSSFPKRDPLTIGPETPVRLMALVEKTADAAPDATSMLVFWEYVLITDAEPAPQGADVISFTFQRPGSQTQETRQFWKGAEEFYDRINWHVHLDSTELWFIVNLSPDTHPIHVHLVSMEIKQRLQFDFKGVTKNADGTTTPLPTTSTEINGNTDIVTDITTTTELSTEFNTAGPKDTMRVNPGEAVSIAMQFSPFSGRYMYHCHILEHEDHDMMRPFTVIPKWVPHHHH